MLQSRDGPAGYRTLGILLKLRPMAIFDREPADWAELQAMVGQLFAEVGCTVTVGETVTLVRGQKEIDVLVRDPGTTPSSVYLC